MKSPSAKTRLLLYRIAAFAILLVLWWVASWRAGPNFVPNPIQTLQAAQRLAVGGKLWDALWDSLRVYLTGFSIAIAVALTWAVVGVGIMRLEVGKWVNNVGAILKVLIIFSLGVGGVVFAARHGTANSISGSDFVPSFDVAKTFLPVIIYLLMGFELVSSMAGEVKRPERDIPRAVFTSGVTIAFLYLFATIGILLALSLTKLELVQGLIDTFEVIFGSSGVAKVAVYALGIGALYTYFTNMTTWTMGANRSAVEAANEGELPRVLGREHPTHRTPVAALVMTGAISTAVLVLTALFINTQDNLFFAIFAASSVIFLLPYLLMFPAVVVLRRKDPERPRPFRMPGGGRQRPTANKKQSDE